MTLILPTISEIWIFFVQKKARQELAVRQRLIERLPMEVRKKATPEFLLFATEEGMSNFLEIEAPSFLPAE